MKMNKILTLYPMLNELWSKELIRHGETINRTIREDK